MDGSTVDIQLGQNEKIEFGIFLQGIATVDTGGSFNITGNGEGSVAEKFPSSLGGLSASKPISGSFNLYADDDFNVVNAWASLSGPSVPLDSIGETG
jgi:hypothetical protein